MYGSSCAPRPRPVSDIPEGFFSTASLSASAGPASAPGAEWAALASTSSTGMASGLTPWGTEAIRLLSAELGCPPSPLLAAAAPMGDADGLL